MGADWDRPYLENDGNVTSLPNHGNNRDELRAFVQIIEVLALSSLPHLARDDARASRRSTAALAVRT